MESERRALGILQPVFFTLPLGLDNMRVKGYPLVSFTIAIVCIIVFVGTFPMEEEVAYGMLGTIPAKGWLQHGVLTSMFVHAGLLHLLGNLIFFYLSGPVIEDAWGRAKFLGLYFGGGIIADFTQIALDAESVIPVVGASGAIAACMGALVVVFPSGRSGCST